MYLEIRSMDRLRCRSPIMPNTSFYATKTQFRNRTKTVTRRTGKRPFKIGEIYTAIEKGQGLKKGEHVVILGKFIPVSARWEPLDRMIKDPAYGIVEVIKEGFPEMTPEEFVEMFCTMNHVPPNQVVQRVEFKYID